MKYGYTKEFNGNFNEAVSKVKEALSKEGFGVLTEIDVRETMKKKLNKEYDNYLIIGACNPMFADRAIEVEKEIGLMLPCNTIIYENGQKVLVSVILPTVAMMSVENEKLSTFAEEVEGALKRALDSINSRHK